MLFAEKRRVADWIKSKISFNQNVKTNINEFIIYK